MFEKFTEKAKRVLFFARYEASQSGSPAIETEHLLLGLIREDKNLPNLFRPRSILSLDGVRQEIEARIPPREKVPTSVDLPFSRGSIRVLNFAEAEAARLAHRYIGTEHILLGLLREEQTLAGEILRQQGLELSAVRQRIAAPTFQHEKESISTDLPFSKESIKVLNFAKEEAERLAQTQVGPEHILLGLLQEAHAPAAEILRQKGLEIATVRQSLAKATGAQKGSADAQSSDISKGSGGSSTEAGPVDISKISVLSLTDEDRKFLRQLKISPPGP